MYAAFSTEAAFAAISVTMKWGTSIQPSVPAPEKFFHPAMPTRGVADGLRPASDRSAESVESSGSGWPFRLNFEKRTTSIGYGVPEA